MKLPEEYRVLIITLSDRASRGEYPDLSGPEVKKLAEEFFTGINSSCNARSVIIPDDEQILREMVTGAVVENDLIITTGGTGIGPRDITPDVIRPMLTRELPGIMEYIRIKYGSEKPGALISRSVAGVIGRCLVYTLPGSVKAVREYMNEITRTLEHTYLMLYGIDRHK